MKNITTKENQTISSIFIITAGICWGIIGVFSKSLYNIGFTSIEITFLRSFITVISLLIYVLITNFDKLSIAIKDVWIFLCTGILSIVFFNVMYFITIKLTSLSIAAILLYTAPCFVMILSSIFFHEKITKQKLISLLIALLGCILTTGIINGLFTNNGLDTISYLGILTGICSGIGYALYSIFGKIALKKYDSLTVTTYTFLFASLFLLPFIMNKPFILKLQSSTAILDSLGIGIISTLLPFTLYTLGLKHTDPSKASVMAFIEPMVATIVGVIIFKETLKISNILGILLIFVSICIINISPKDNP